MPPVPAALVEATVRREGEAGRAWLAGLPDLIAHVASAWGCEIVGDAPGRSIGHGEVAVVVPVRRAGDDAVLKISFPHASFDGEIDALRHFGGRGTVRLLDADERRCAVLLERAGPRTLASVPSTDEAIEIAGALARQLAIPAPETAPSLASATAPWEEQLDQQAGAAADLLSPDLLPPSAVRRARETIGAIARDGTSTMAHGDLHAGNVLAAVREPWLAIDPVGWRGTAAFDAFTVIAGRRAEQGDAADFRTLRARIRRYAEAAHIDADLALACTQARATSAYLHQLLHDGDWFDPDFLRASSMLVP